MKSVKNFMKYGNDVGFEKRLEDIESRYGSESIVYLRCKSMVEYLKSKTLIHGQGLLEKDIGRE